MGTLPTTQATGSSNGLKPFGRLLGHFQPLKPAETKLLDSCRLGEIALIGTSKRPTEKTNDNEIRPGFIRFLLLGGDHEAPVHEKGVQATGAWIDGTLDLNACHCQAPLYLGDCKIEGDVNVADAILPKIIIANTLINSFYGDRVRTLSSIHLVNGFNASEDVRLPGAKIGGSFSCSAGKIEPQKGIALNCEGATIDGDLMLSNGFHATGQVTFTGAIISGDVTCDKGEISSEEGCALSLSRAQIGGRVSFNKGFHAKGEVRLIGTTVGGDLSCIGANFENAGDDALCCERAVVRGALFFRKIASIIGTVNFTGANFNSIIDDTESWGLATHLELDGLTYQRIGFGGTTASKGIEWLKRQQSGHLNSDFRPQPWEQLIKVLREMGHDEDARAVAIEKQRTLYAAGKIEGFLPRLLHNIYGELSSYGYGPLRTIWWIVGVWLVCGFIYWNSDQRGILGPSLPAIHANAEMKAKCGNQSGIRLTTWTICKDLPQEYTTFSSLAYSLDLILPLVDLQQDKDWAPIVPERATPELILLGVLTRMVMWFEILFGWGTSLLLAAVLGNLVKKD